MSWTTGLAIYGAALASLSTFWQFVVQRREGDAARRERASRVVGDAVSLLWSVDPSTGFVGGIPRERQEEAIGRYSDRLESLRRDLEALQVADARPAVRRHAGETLDATTKSFASSVWAIRQRRDRAVDDPDAQWNAIKADHAAAVSAAEKLREAVQA